MYIISFLPTSSVWLEMVIDVFLLIILLSPALYFFLFLPLARYYKAHQETEAALLDSEMRWRTVFETSPDSITVSRLKDGRIIIANHGFTAISGYTAEDVIGKSSLDINLWQNSKDREEMVARLQKNGHVINFEAELNRKDGGVMTGLLSARVIELDAEPHLLAVTRDITEWKKAKQKLKASYQFLQIANKHREMTSLLNEFTTEIKKMTGCSAVGMYVLNGDDSIPYQAFEGFDRQFYESENRLTLQSLECMCAKILQKKTNPDLPYFTRAGSFFIDSTTRFLETLSETAKEQTCTVCNKFGYESVALIPIGSGDNTLGLIHVADPRANMFASETLDLLEGVAMQLGPAIERIRARETLQRSHQALEKQVEKRTARLLAANERLNREIEERIRSERMLRDQQEKLRSLSSQLLLTEERERRRIATELHDRIGQTLAITKIKLGILGQASPSKEITEAVAEIREFVEQTIQDTRSLTFELSPPILYELGLEAAIAWLVKKTQEKYGIRIEFKDDGQPKPLDDSGRVIIFQATRELLFNVVKHARARNTTVSIRKDDGTIRIDIEDDGVGFDTFAAVSGGAGTCGFGHFSIRERLNPLGGDLRIESVPGRGTRVSMILPLNSKTKTTET